MLRDAQNFAHAGIEQYRSARVAWLRKTLSTEQISK
jgi:hypothetical protein